MVQMLANELRSLVGEAKRGLDGGENFVKIARHVASKLFDASRKRETTRLITVVPFWVFLTRTLSAIAERIVTEEFPRELSAFAKGEDHGLARGVLRFLLRKDLAAINYERLIDYESGEVKFEEIRQKFALGELELPAEERAFVALAIATALDKSWMKAREHINKLVKERVDALYKELEAVEDGEKALEAFKKASEEILYELHLEALG